MFKKLLISLLLLTAGMSAQVTLSGPTTPFNPVVPNELYSLITITGNGTGTIALQGDSTIILRITGTYTAATTQFLVSNDNTNFTPLALSALSTTLDGSILSGANTAVNGLYTAGVTGMTQLRVINSGTFTGTSQIIRVIGTANPGAASGTVPDPCQDKMVLKQSVGISGTAPSTVIAIPNTAGKTTFVCDISLVDGTAATSIQIKAGTGTTCGTNTVNLTGAIPITVGQQMFAGWGGTVFGAPQILPSTDVCVAVAGGTAGFAGWATYVQR